MAFRDPVLIRRARRRRRLILLTFLASIVAVLALAFRYQSERRQTIDYLNEAGSIAEQHQEMSLLLADLFSALGEADREDILARLDSLSEQAGQVDLRIDALVVTPTVAVANGQLRVAHSAWKTAIDSAAPVIVVVLDAPDDKRNGDRGLQAMFVQLLVGDRAYADLLATLVGLDADFELFPDFDYVGPERQTLYDAAVVGDRLRAVLELVESHDIAITASLDPEAADERGDIAVVPNTGSFSVLVVVSNNGNVQESAIEVVMQLIPESGESATFSELVPSLDPGGSVSVDFRELEIVVGLTYELRLTATVAQDEDLDNNTTQLTFVINSDS